MNKHIHKIISRGIKEDDSIEVRRQIGLLNTATLCCFITLSFFMGLNVYHHNWVLLANNGVLFILTTCLLFISRLKFFNVSIIILATLFSVYFFIDAVLFHNALQYAIPVMMVVSVLLIHSNTWRIAILSLQICLFMGYIFLENRPPIIEPLPAYRNYLTTFSMLIILALMLQYFKRKQLLYIKNLSSLNEKLQESNRVKERMLSILSHDFNAPVGNLVASLNMVDAEILTPRQFNDISAKLQAQLSVLTTSLSDVLHWSKMQVTGEAATPSFVNIKALLDELLLFFDYALKDKMLHVQNNVGATVVAYANKDYLKLIFRNLLSNAIKFSYLGKVVIINAFVQSNTVNISIIDEGVGMQPAMLTALQQQQLSFSSVPGTLNEKGTGLGLLLIQEFLQKSNGSLAVESSPGRGSSFTILLPTGI